MQSAALLVGLWARESLGQAVRGDDARVYTIVRDCGLVMVWLYQLPRRSPFEPASEELVKGVERLTFPNSDANRSTSDPGEGSLGRQ